MTWYFREVSPGSTTRDPIQGEFFAEDAIANPAQSLVRESIQNSLDARADHQAPVRVRIYVSGAEGALGQPTVSPFLAETWPHVGAPRNGLRNAPSMSEPCRFVLVEDFNTTGLTGEITQHAHEPDVANPFFAFFRSEGISDKSQGDRGRWGIGKFVFPRSSRTSCFFGLSVRGDGSAPVLLGRMILKSHRISGRIYEPDGYFGRRSENGLVLPLADADVRGFAAAFGITRSSESGLSVVVPYPDPEIEAPKVVAAVVRDYYHALLAQDLEVEVASPSGTTRITGETLPEALSQLEETERQSLDSTIALSRWAMRQPSSTRIVLNSPGGARAPRWTQEVVSPEMLNAIRDGLRTGRVAIRVPVSIQPRGSGVVASHFDVFLEKGDDTTRYRPAFVREGILVSDVGGRGVRRVRSLVVINEGPLASFLGDAENPAHTRWLKEGTNFKGKYTYGPGTLAYVIESVSALSAMLEEADREADRSLLAPFFSIDMPGELQSRRTSRRPSVTPPIPPIPSARPPRYRLRQMAGGFSLTSVNSGNPRPEGLRIRVGYGTRSGNPISLWQKFDFDLAEAPITVAAEGLTLEECQGNTISASVTSSDFRLEVTGFDKFRDLTVRVDLRDMVP